MSLPDPRAQRERRAAYVMITPAVVLFVLFILAPLAGVLVFSFTDYQLGYSGFQFVGLENYAELWSDRGFRRSMYNTFLYTLVVAPVSIFMGLGLALLIQAEPMGQALFRTVFFLPVASLLVAMATVWQYLLHPTIGPVNGLLSLFGVPSISWLASSSTVLWSLSAIGIWQAVGYNLVLFMAGLTAIPRDLYAAARMDGARSPLAQFRLVTWPMLGPTTLFVTTISIINAVKTFETVQTLTQGGAEQGVGTAALYHLHRRLCLSARGLCLGDDGGLLGGLDRADGAAIPRTG